MYTTESPLLQGEQAAKSEILAVAEGAADASGVPFRVGRLSRLVGNALNKHGTGAAWLCMWDELHRAAQAITNPSVRNAVGVIDPTGALAAARVDWERSLAPSKKKALDAGGNQLEGDDQHPNLHEKELT